MYSGVQGNVPGVLSPCLPLTFSHPFFTSPSKHLFWALLFKFMGHPPVAAPSHDAPSSTTRSAFPTASLCARSLRAARLSPTPATPVTGDRGVQQASRLVAARPVVHPPQPTRLVLGRVRAHTVRERRPCCRTRCRPTSTASCLAPASCLSRLPFRMFRMVLTQTSPCT